MSLRLAKLRLPCLLVFAAALAHAAPPQFGQPAPPLAIRLLQGPPQQPLDWASLRGTAVVIDFWATWCAGCVAAMDHFSALAEKFRSKPVRFIALSDEDEPTIRRFLAQRPIKSLVALDRKDATFRAYAIEGRPAYAFIDAYGVLRGIVNTEIQEAQVSDLLAGVLRISQPEKTSGAGVTAQTDVPLPIFSVVIRPAGDHPGYSPGAGFTNGNRQEQWGVSGLELLARAYHVDSSRILAPSWCADKRFDIELQLPDLDERSVEAALRPAVDATLGLTVHRESRSMDVFVLTALPSAAVKLRPLATGKPIMRVAAFAESFLHKPVVDETGLKGRYSLFFAYPRDFQSLTQWMQSNGLQLSSAKRSIDVLVAEPR